MKNFNIGILIGKSIIHDLPSLGADGLTSNRKSITWGERKHLNKIKYKFTEHKIFRDQLKEKYLPENLTIPLIHVNLKVNIFNKKKIINGINSSLWYSEISEYKVIDIYNNNNNTTNVIIKLKRI